VEVVQSSHEEVPSHEPEVVAAGDVVCPPTGWPWPQVVVSVLEVVSPPMGPMGWLQVVVGLLEGLVVVCPPTGPTGWL
jgi:hypothetical protein